MPVVNDYTCRECGHAFEMESIDEVVDVFCEYCEVVTRCDKRWRAPHLGSMSSGEPPR